MASAFRIRRGVGALPALLFAWRGIGGGGYGKQIVDAPPALGIVVDVEQTLG